ncbi:MAG: DUF465 domain-containing protein [Caulobacterales bacterium]|nr:DUF465 domain-containing protein [Caulobacterales bacterium]
MAIDARIRELGNRHRDLDHRIQEELRHPSTDTLTLRDLKRRKLRIKEEIQVLETQA